MPRLPARFAAVILCFAPPFFQRSWRHAEVLLVGAILAPGRRTVSNILRITGLHRERQFVNYHRVLNRAAWSGRAAARALLGFCWTPSCRPGRCCWASTTRSSAGAASASAPRGSTATRSAPATAISLRRVACAGSASCCWWLVRFAAQPPWAGQVWALPFLTTLAPSERYCRERGRRPKKLTDWGRQLVLQARRWVPGRRLVLVTDSGFSALEFLAALLRQEVTCVTRLRLDAALYRPAPPRPPGTIGRPRSKGERLPTLAEVLADKTTRWQRVTVPGWYGEGERVVEICSDTAVWRHSGLPVVPTRWVLLRDPCRRFDPQALLCTDRASQPLQIVRWFVQRWQLDVTFREVRDHLGVKTQRQWSDKAIARTTPCLLGLFSIVTLLASRLDGRARLKASASAWYHKQPPTFADSLAAVRRAIWTEQGFAVSRRSFDATKLPPALREDIAYALCHAA
jgi:hypothetical protein